MAATRRESKVGGGEVARRSALALALTLLIVTGMAALGDGGSVRGEVAGAQDASVTGRNAPSAWYVAVGDSLAAGVGATSPSRGYVGDVYAAERVRLPGLALADLGCTGATTTSVMDGGGCAYPARTQLAQAEAFLAGHRGRVAFVTVDLGINDVDGCLATTGTDGSCVAAGMDTVRWRLAAIVTGLQQADPGVPVFGLDYYDPFVGWWATGDATHAVALATAPVLQALDAELGAVYSQAGVPVADVAGRFQLGDATPTASGTPVEVADVCRWTLMCTHRNLHPDDAGHAVLAGALVAAIDRWATTDPLPGS
jgi:lysophospholipase L1-like esterase